MNRQLPASSPRQGKNGQELFLTDELDVFVNGYLPNFKTWATRSSLLREFHRGLDSQTGFIATPQPCEISACGESAGLHLRVTRNVGRMLRHEKSASPTVSTCGRGETRASASHAWPSWMGDLQGRFQIAGTEERIRRDHPVERRGTGGRHGPRSLVADPR